MSPSSLSSRSSRAATASLTAALAGVITLLAALFAQPAMAHSELLESTPADGSTVSEAPRQVQLVFGEDVVQQGGAIVVEASDGARVDQAKTFATDANVATVQLVNDTPPGQYTVNFRVVSADGHIVSDTFDYRLKSTPQPSASPSDSATTSQATTEPSSSPVAATDEGDEDSGVSVVWVLGLGAIGLALVAAMIAVAVRGRRDRSD